MTISVIELVERFKYLGYEITVNDGKIRCIHVGQDKPKEDEVYPLIDRLKSSKKAVIEYLQFLSETGLTAREYELERYIGAPDMNPDKYPCVRCGVIAGRYCLGLNKEDRFTWGWQCLRCRPYTEPERN